MTSCVARTLGGCGLLLFASVSTAVAQQNVSWKDLVQVTATGNSLQKTGGCAGCQDAGAASNETIASGDGYIEFTATETNKLRQIGLSSSNPGTTTAEIQFSIRLSESGIAEVRESNSYRTETSYVGNDRFKIAIVGASVVYSKNDVAFRTSTNAGVQYPLLVDTALLGSSSTVTNVVMFGTSGTNGTNVAWTDTIDVTATGNSLQKTAGCDGCNAGAASVQTISSGDGWVEFTAIETIKLRQIGLSNSNPGLTTAEIDFSIRLTEVGIAEVRESDAYRIEVSYAANDRFRIAVVGLNVVYSKNDTVFRTTLAPAITYPLLIDTALLNTNATLTNVVISGGSGGGNVPTSYTARTDRDPTHTIRPTQLTGVPTNPVVRVPFEDESFPGSRVLRVTDATGLGTSPAGVSYRTPSAPSQTGWSSDSSRFYAITTQGAVHVFNFNDGTPTHDRQLAWALEPAFSRVNPSLMYGTRNITTHVIEQYDFASGGYTALLSLSDVDTTIPANTYTGSIYASGGSTERIVVRYGGTSQDMHDRVIIFNKDAPATYKIIDTDDSKLNGVTTNIPLGFTTHAVFIDHSGRYTILYPAGVSGTQYVFDWNTNTFAKMEIFSNGHDALGHGARINQEASNDQAYDAAQWQYRALATPNTRSDRITPPLTPSMTYEADHTSWHNAQAGSLVPVLSALYRYWDDNSGAGGQQNNVSWRAWDNEIIAFATTGSTMVWRFCHHWSQVAPDTGTSGGGFYYFPRPQIAPNGRWALFTSNWMKTLGIDSYSGDSTTTKRQDVFLVKLPQ